jgi:hypothetical protein
MTVGEAESHELVRDRRTHPIDRGEVHRVELAEIECPVIVGERVVGLAAVVGVAYVVQRDAVTLEGCISKDCVIRLPRAVVGRLEVEPTDEQQ